MKMLTVTTTAGLDGKQHFTLASIGQKSWPIAMLGLTDGAMAKESRREAEFLAASTSMYDMLEALAFEFDNINPKFPIAPGKAAFLSELVSRAQALVDKHKGALP